MIYNDRRPEGLQITFNPPYGKKFENEKEAVDEEAGQAASNIRRWLFKEDVIDCIVKLPKDIFFRTGINTYLWILSTNKPEGRKGKIQLMDASGKGTVKLKSHGNKRMEISESDMDWIARVYIDGHNGGKSILVPCEDFMYRKVTVERPCGW